MRKLVAGLVAGVLVLALLLWFGGRWYLARSVAPYGGDIPVPGLGQPVEVTFDARGIPQLWAQTDADLMVALGWVHASERLFQMELVRRLAAGELAEVFGEAAYETDVQQRRLGFARKARRDAPALDETVRLRLQRYADGVNAYVDQAGLLPPEFVLLRFRPRPWTVEDCLAVALYQTWYAHALMDQDPAYQRLVTRLGDEARPLLQAYQPWSPPTVPAGTVPPAALRMTEASNAWVVAPHRSASGAALHASDPHLTINQTPGMWYAAGLHSAEGTDVVGVTVPGLPFVTMGHNDAVSFAFTVASVDVVDYYRVARDPADSLRVQTATGAVPMEAVEEEVRVQGEAGARRVRLLATPYGVVVDEEPGAVVALRWAGFDTPAGAVVAAGFALQRARTFDAFRRAVTGMGALDVNWTYADRAGNIGYQLGTPLPVRGYTDTFSRLDAADSAKAWHGYRALDETPHALNPARGWLASSNNQIVPADWPYALPGFYDPYRITRAETLLTARPAFTRAHMAAMQLDRVSGRSLRWKALAADGADRIGRPEVAARLRAWDGSMAASDTTAALFSYWWVFLCRGLFEDELGEEWKEGRHLLEAVLDAGASFVDDRRTPAVEGRADVAARAMAAALQAARGRPYGAVSTLTVAHPLGRVKLLDWWLHLSRGPVPAGGDAGSLNANFNDYDEAADRFVSYVGPSMRFVLDWAAVDSFTLDLAFGQSGNPFSPHYDDFFAPMQRGERWVVPFTREAVYARKVTLLRLRPGAG